MMAELRFEEMSVEQLVIWIMQRFANLKDENKKAYLSWLRDRHEEEADALVALLEYWLNKKATVSEE